MLTHRGCYSGATLVLYPYRHCRGSPEARVAVPLLVHVLERRANPLGGRRLCPRFADHTGRLTSFNTPYLSLLPSWAGRAAQTTQAGGAPAKGYHAPSHWWSNHRVRDSHSNLGPEKKRKSTEYCSSRAAHPMTRKSYAVLVLTRSHTHTHLRLYQGASWQGKAGRGASCTPPPQLDLLLGPTD